MRRSFLFLIQLALVVGVAIWLVENPGDIRIDWFGWRVETHFALFLIVVAVLVWVLSVVWRTLAAALGAPSLFMRRRSDRRREDGFRALSLGMAAVAAGDAEEARRRAREADRLLRDPDLTRLLSAQAATLAGDSAAAARYFAALRDNKDTAFLGLVGLLRQAAARGDETHALELAEEAYALRPDASYVATLRLHGLARAGRWFDAQRALYDAARRGIVEDEDGRRKRAALLVERARDAADSNNRSDALDLVAKARESAPNHVPAIALEARLLAETGKPKRAQRLIEDRWASCPHPELAMAYRTLLGDDAPIAAFKKVHTLADTAPDHLASRLMVAEAALDADLWGEARVQLDALAAEDLTPRACRIRARLEDVEHGDGPAARRWLERAAQANPDPAWTCDQCGAVAERWSAVCGHCGAFATVAWTRPPRVTVLTAIADDDDATPLLEGQAHELPDTEQPASAA